MQRRVYKALLTDRVVVNMRTGKAFSGVVWEEHHDLLVLRAAKLLEPTREPVDLDGDVVLDRQVIDFIQRMPR